MNMESQFFWWQLRSPYELINVWCLHFLWCHKRIYFLQGQDPGHSHFNGISINYVIYVFLLFILLIIIIIIHFLINCIPEENFFFLANRTLLFSTYRTHGRILLDSYTILDDICEFWMQIWLGLESSEGSRKYSIHLC